MLYLIHGSDTDKTREKARELVASLQKKKPEAEVFRLGSDNWNEARFDEFISSQGLFERKFIVFANRLLENKEAKAAVTEKLPAIQQSENIFIFLEGAVDKATLLEIAEAAEKVQVFEKTEKERFNVFSLANALRARDRRGLWVSYQKAVRNGALPEELSGVLFWQIKTLLATGSRNFSPAELETLALNIVRLYHDAHRGLVDFETGLERFVLTV
ncbi:MAG: hypothetical protein HYV67_03890 [Candidatus Taylorbacteria bacterium]|nr:hypothetical protein [Candidatus Taylorbacteria bacterium]